MNHAAAIFIHRPLCSPLVCRTYVTPSARPAAKLRHREPGSGQCAIMATHGRRDTQYDEPQIFSISRVQGIAHFPLDIIQAIRSRDIIMPTITNMRLDPARSGLEQPLYIELSLRVPSAGPVTIRIELDEELPYFFSTAGRQVREICFTRTFASAGDHTARCPVSLINSTQSPDLPSITATAAGIDGSSVPFTITLDTH